MIILGAGMAGLLAANILRNHLPLVIERKDHLPDNHHALLRFRTDAVSQATGIPFKKVMVNKAIVLPTGQVTTTSDLKYSNMYALKVTGSVASRSIMSLAPAERFIAPHNFVERMANSARVELGRSASADIFASEPRKPIISTIPMPAMMDLLGWDLPRPDFLARAIVVLSAEIVAPSCDVYQTLYYPGANTPVYRISITGRQLIVEAMADLVKEQMLRVGVVEESDRADSMSSWANAIIQSAMVDLGISNSDYDYEIKKISTQPLGKIHTNDRAGCRTFIHRASEDHHIYSLGRFATWRQILMDDLVKDVRFVEEFITQRDLYSARAHTIKGV